MSSDVRIGIVIGLIVVAVLIVFYALVFRDIFG